MVIGMNDTVLVKLTDLGRVKFREHHLALLRESGLSMKRRFELSSEETAHHRIDEEWSSFLLWELVHYFGPYTSQWDLPCFTELKKKEES